MRQRLIVTMVVAGLLTVSCATFPPKTPTGQIDVVKLVQWAEWGIQADCASDPEAAVCTVGTAALAIVKSKGQDPVAVLAALVDIETRYPAVKPYTHWLTRLLGGPA